MTNHPDIVAQMCRERAEGYGALRQSAPTARALDAAAALIEAQAAEIARLRGELAGRDELIAAYVERYPTLNYAIGMAMRDTAQCIRDGQYRATAIASGVIEEKGSE